MPVDEAFRIGELAEMAGVTKRTVHYYIGRGLLPPPEGSGVNSIYNSSHLARIRLVKKLQDRFLPLDRIRDIMLGLDDSQVAEMLQTQEDAPFVLQTEAAMTSPILCESNEGGWRSGKEQEWDAGFSRGSAYVRVHLGGGLELHCPLELENDYRDVVQNIRKYAEKLLEGR